MSQSFEGLSFTLPYYSQPSIRYTVFTAIVAACFLITPESEEEFNKKLDQFAAGEMILVSKLADKAYEQKIGAIVFLGFVYLFVGIVLPISTMVSTI